MTRRDLEMYRGDTYIFDVTVMEGSSPVNLSGYSFRMTAKYSIGDTSSLFTLTSPGNISITNASTGEIEVTIPPSATSSLAPYQYRLNYDIQASSGAQSVYTVCSGLLIVYPDCSTTVP